jgi:hypothetical protein
LAVNHGLAYAPAPVIANNLINFYEQNGLFPALKEKLLALGVQGPHVLCWIKDDYLCGEGRVLLGELGSLCDAEQFWKNSFVRWD